MEDLNILRNKFNTQQREILTIIWRHYVKKSHWMPARLLHVTNGGKKVVRPIIEQLGGSIVYEPEENGTPYYALTFLGVLLSSDGEHIEELLAHQLSSNCANLGSARAPPHACFKQGSSHSSPSWSQRAGGTWTLSFSLTICF